MAWLGAFDRWFIEEILPHRTEQRRYARRWSGSDSDAEDLLQEAYLSLAEGDRWREVRETHRYVLRTIRNLAIDRVRRSRVVSIEQGAMLDTIDLPDASPGPALVAESRSELGHVQALIRDLPEQSRKVLTLRKIEGLPPREIAERLSLSVSTVEKHLSRAVRLLTERRRASDVYWLNQEEATPKCKAMSPRQKEI